jgi:hypothetical protein
VFLCGLLFTAIWGYEFNSVGRFAAAMAVIPAIMTVVEATAPHSMDTPTMMIIGYSTLYLIAI